jgi:hypothetical protein
VQERRLGQLRQRQHQDDLPVHSVRRSQRHARSADRRHYGKNSGDAGDYGYTRDDKRVEKAIKFIFSEQEPDGSWFGRWGVNYIYGTFLVLRGLDAIGIDHLEPQIQQAAEWIRMVQNPDGGWGETCGSYDDPNTRGIGPSTPSQTAWALLGLLAAGDDRSDSIGQGRALAAHAAETRRKLGRDHGRAGFEAPGALHWNRLPQSLLSGLRNVPRNTSRCWL